MMPNLVERIEQELFAEPPRKKSAPMARLGGVALVAGIVSAGLGDGLTRIDIDAVATAVTSGVMEVALPDPEFKLSETDPLVASLVGGAEHQPEAPVVNELNEFALFSDEHTASVGAKPMPTDLRFY